MSEKEKKTYNGDALAKLNLTIISSGLRTKEALFHFIIFTLKYR